MGLDRVAMQTILSALLTGLVVEVFCGDGESGLSSGLASLPNVCGFAGDVSDSKPVDIRCLCRF